MRPLKPETLSTEPFAKTLQDGCTASSSGLDITRHGADSLYGRLIIVFAGGLIPWVSFIGDRWIDYCFPIAAGLIWIALIRGGVSWRDYFEAIPRVVAVSTAGLMIMTAVAAARVFDRVDFLDQLRLLVLPGTVYLALYMVIAAYLMRRWPLQHSVLRAAYVGFGIGCALLAVETLSGGAFGHVVIAAIIEEGFASSYFNRAEMMLAIIAWTTAPLVAARYGPAAGIAGPALVWTLGMFGQSEMIKAGLPISIVLYLLALRSPRLVCDSAFAAAMLALISAPFVYPLLYELAPSVPLMSTQKFMVRAEIWDAVSRFALDAPMFGHGINSTRLAGPVPMEHLYYPDAIVWHPHNGFLQIWADLGAAGVLAVAGLIVAVWRATRELPSSALPMVVASFTLTVLAVISTHAVWSTWWLGFMAFNAGYLVVLVTLIRSGAIASLLPLAVKRSR